MNDPTPPTAALRRAVVVGTVACGLLECAAEAAPRAPARRPDRTSEVRSRHADMSHTEEWLDGYFRAWRSKNADDVHAIFTEDAEYWFQPDDPGPVRGLDAIVSMWAESKEPTEPVFEFAVLIEDEHLGIAKGWVDYPGHQRYSNLWEIRFGDDGRATRFVEWYMKATDRT